MLRSAFIPGAVAVLIVASCTSNRAVAPATTATSPPVTSRPASTSPSTSPATNPVNLPVSSPARPGPLAKTPRHLAAGVLDVIPLYADSAPTGMTIGFGSVWVEEHHGTDVVRINPHTNKIIATIDTGQDSCGLPQIGLGRVWVQSCDDGSGVTAIDPTTNLVVGKLPGTSFPLAFAAGSVWVGSQPGPDVFRIDPTTYKVQARIHTGSVNGSITFGAGLVWAAPADQLTGEWDGTLDGIDPATNKIVKRYALKSPGGYSFTIFAYGHLWIQAALSYNLLRVDPATGHVRSFKIGGTLPGNSDNFDVFPIPALGSIWLRPTNGKVFRVNVRTGRVIGTFPADPHGGGGYVAIGFGSLWVVNYDSATVWRDRLK
jgi:streptogramin lyase